MEIIKKIDDIRERINIEKRAGKSVGFVPTMGYLHQGHLSLVESASVDNDVVVASIFVNPTQFGPGEDFESYPRDLDQDTDKLEQYGVDFVFAPDAREMYPEGYNTFVEVEGLTDRLCGSSRPGHFRGVTTIVTKLFNIVQPDRAYFGRKDFQQLVVIKRMVSDLNMPIEIIGVPIVREEDGLAMSSRNKYLNSREREAALILYRALQRGAEMIKSGVRDLNQVKEELTELIDRVPEARIDYVAVVDPETLQKMDFVRERVLIALAVYIGDTRLIDNTLIEI